MQIFVYITAEEHYQQSLVEGGVCVIWNISFLPITDRLHGILLCLTEIMTFSQMCRASEWERGERKMRKEGSGLLIVRQLGGVDLPFGLLVRYSCSRFFFFFGLASRVLDSKSMAAAAVLSSTLWPFVKTREGLQMHCKHQVWPFIVPNTQKGCFHTKCNNLNSGQDICISNVMPCLESTVGMWSIMCKVEGNIFFYAWESTAHFPHANKAASKKRKAKLLEGWQCCVENVVLLALRLPQSPSVCQWGERGSEP